MGARIREIRGGRTQFEFARELGLSRTVLANLETGRRMPNEQVLQRLAEVSSQSRADIMFGPHFTSHEVVSQVVSKGWADLSTSENLLARDGLSLLRVLKLAEKVAGFSGLLAALLEMAATRAATPEERSSVAQVRKAIAREDLRFGAEMPIVLDPAVGSTASNDPSKA